MTRILDGETLSQKGVDAFLEKGWAVAFTDGSYAPKEKIYSYGVCAFKDARGVQISLKGIGDDAECAPSRNVAGEILGVEKAVEWAEANNVRRLLIYHDYEGIGKWPDGAWRAKNDLSRNYIDFIREKRNKIRIAFLWIRGHSGIIENEWADKLAHDAITERRGW